MFCLCSTSDGSAFLCYKLFRKTMVLYFNQRGTKSWGGVFLTCAGNLTVSNSAECALCSLPSQIIMTVYCTIRAVSAAPKPQISFHLHTCTYLVSLLAALAFPVYLLLQLLQQFPCDGLIPSCDYSQMTPLLRQASSFRFWSHPSPPGLIN